MKLTEEQLEQAYQYTRTKLIRERQAALAKQFGVHVRVVEKALSYATWRHVAENTA